MTPNEPTGSSGARNAHHWARQKGRTIFQTKRRPTHKRVQVPNQQNCIQHVQHSAYSICCPIYTVTKNRGQLPTTHSIQQRISGCGDSEDVEAAGDRASSGHQSGINRCQRSENYMQRGGASHRKTKVKAQQRTEERVRNSVGAVSAASAGQTQSKQRLGMCAT